MATSKSFFEDGECSTLAFATNNKRKQPPSDFIFVFLFLNVNDILVNLN
jgi:hypothetical protein